MMNSDIEQNGFAIIPKVLSNQQRLELTSQRHRRVLHIEYAGFTLPAELQWHEAA